MSNHQQAVQTERVREFVKTWFARLGAQPDDGVAETLLIRNGFFCGRRLRCGEVEAVWFFEEHQIKVYGADGAVAHVFDVNALLPSDSRRAA